jgi:Fe-coproporphyrin III synthase
MLSSLHQTYQRYRTLQTHTISSLPIAILMPHSACNCRCIMCDIWKGNAHAAQLNELDIQSMLATFKKLGTQQVLMSGGEALLNPLFFNFCAILKKQGIYISLLSAGLTLEKNAAQLVEWVDEIIVSLDGDEALHDSIRNVPHAFQKLQQGIAALRLIQPSCRITGRTVIHRLNYRHWPAIIDTAKLLGLRQISFLPADTSSQAFNRAIPWDNNRQNDVLVPEEELAALKLIIVHITVRHNLDFASGLIAESPAKLMMIYKYYAALHGHGQFPVKKCNAPWVATVVEADGSVRPCFFHDVYGNIKNASLDTIVNSRQAIAFRRNLDMQTNETCLKCVCYLNLPPGRRAGG